MQIHELAHARLNEDTLTPDQINKIFDYVDKAYTAAPAASADQGPIAQAAELSPKSLLNKGMSALLRRPKINVEKLRTIWAGMRNDPTTENISRMLTASGVNQKVIRDALRRNVPYGPLNPSPSATNVTKPAPASAPAPAPAPAAPKYASPAQVVDALMKTMPKDWLPEITAELLKRQRVGAVKK